MVEVAVIGAGAAGLVTARHLLRLGLRTWLFDSRFGTGGAWTAAKRPDDTLETIHRTHPSSAPQMWDNLSPNLSKFTCCFSDMKWPEGTPLFPTLLNMHQYLDDYASRYVSHHEDCTMQLGCTVTRVSTCNNTSSSGENEARYTVEWDGIDGKIQSRDFYGVVVASGFFSTPVWPECLHPWIGCDDDNVRTEDNGTRRRQLLHSSQYRSPYEFTNQTVVVIGGSFSAHEISSDIRRHTGDSTHVVNVVGDRVPYIVPHFVPSFSSTNQQEGFLPIDCVLYRREADAPKASETVNMDDDTCRKRHAKLRQWIGSRKLGQAGARGLSMGQSSSSPIPPFVSISEDYLDFVIDNKISVVPGRLKSVSLSSSSTTSSSEHVPHTSRRDKLSFDLQLEDESIISDVDTIVACTGYRSSLSFLSAEILDTLQYDESDPFAPIVACYDATHPKLPGFGLVGMYKGPYFGVMELQARLISGMLAGNIHLSSQTTTKSIQAAESIRNGHPRAQFPHFDYIGLMDVIAREIDLVPSAEFRNVGLMVSPAFYQPDRDVALACKFDLDALVRKQSASIPRAALSSLIGKWEFERSINDHLTSTSQRVYGEIVYSLHGPDLDCLRYREDGFLDLPNGNRLEVFREYEYLQQNGMINIHFVENGERAHLFLSLKFDENTNGCWRATSDHLCINDLYKGTFQLKFEGLSTTEVSMTYRVKGPNKDYEAVTHLLPIL